MFKIVVGTDKPDIGYLKSQVCEMMHRGVKIGNIKSECDHYMNVCDALYKQLNTYGIQNPNSSTQITNYLIKLADSVDPKAHNDVVEVCYNSYSKKWTSNANALETLSVLGYEFASDIIDYRKAKKYYDTLKGLMDYADSDSKIHPNVSLALTNRINYSSPALMNIPKDILWSVIVPLNEGDSLYSVDIKNQEPGILFNYLDDNVLKESLMCPDGIYVDLFRKVFKPEVHMSVLTGGVIEPKIFSYDELKDNVLIQPAYYMPELLGCNSYYADGKKVVSVEHFCQGYSVSSELKFPESVTIELDDGSCVSRHITWNRDFKLKKSGATDVVGYIDDLVFNIDPIDKKEFKTSWISMTYGNSIFGVKGVCKHIDGARVYKWFNTVEPIKKYKEAISRIVKNGSNGIKTLFGSEVHVDWSDTDRMIRQLLDAPIQGAGADILSMLVKHFNSEIDSRGLTGSLFIYYTRHDELVIEVDKDYQESAGTEEVTNVLNDILEHQVIEGDSEWISFKLEVNKL